MRTILFCYLAAARPMPAEMVDICSNYGHRFDIKFNRLKVKPQFMVGLPLRFVLKLNEAPVPYVDKVKHLGI